MLRGAVTREPRQDHDPEAEFGSAPAPVPADASRHASGGTQVASQAAVLEPTHGDYLRDDQAAGQPGHLYVRRQPAGDAGPAANTRCLLAFDDEPVVKREQIIGW